MRLIRLLAKAIMHCDILCCIKLISHYLIPELCFSLFPSLLCQGNRQVSPCTKPLQYALKIDMVKKTLINHFLYGKDLSVNHAKKFHSVLIWRNI